MLGIGVACFAVACGSGASEPAGATPPTPFTPVMPKPPTAADLKCGGVSLPSEVQVRMGVPFIYKALGGIADVYAPKAGSQTAACPAVIVLPPGCSLSADVTWVGRLLAAHGYVALVASAVIVGNNNVPICAEVASAALDFLKSAANPFRAVTDTALAGGVGYSQAARVLVLLQSQDPRFKAIVAWDNLPKSDLADQGSPSCAGDPGISITPRAPALGLASERCDVAVLGVEAKKPASTRGVRTGCLPWK